MWTESKENNNKTEFSFPELGAPTPISCHSGEGGAQGPGWGGAGPGGKLKKISSMVERKLKSVMDSVALGEGGHVYRIIVCVAGSVLMWRWWSRAARRPSVSVTAVREQRSGGCLVRHC